MSKKTADLMGPTPYPLSEPDGIEELDERFKHPLNKPELEMTLEPEKQEYMWIWANGQIHIATDKSHGELSEGQGIRPKHDGPFAAGYINVHGKKAAWSVETNMGLNGLAKQLEDFTQQQGWAWDGLYDGGGNPVSDDLGPKKSMYYRWYKDSKHLMLSHEFMWDAQPIEIRGKAAYVMPDKAPWIPTKETSAADWSPDLKEALQEWADDFGYRLAEYPGGSQMTERIKTWEDLDTKGWDEHGPEEYKEEHLKGPFKCPKCGEELPTLNALSLHGAEHGEKDYEPIEDGHFPQMGDSDEILPLRRQQTNPTASPISSWHMGAGEPKDMVQEDVPFIYDIEKDMITTGQPGQQTSAIAGQFTPGGIVEGYYKPGGIILITSQTEMPYSTRHLLQLWYYQHPHMEITKVELEGPDGQNTKIANQNVGAIVKTLAASDPAAWTAAQALKAAGGKVYVVGGAVRDTILGRAPKDVDLMVAGLPENHVDDIMGKLPGTMDVTGKRFGVYRYKTKGHEVEVAIPRLDSYEGADKRSEGKITVDPNLPIEEDLRRRDFTANSMAVDLDNNELIDPYKGQDDIHAKALRTTHSSSFSEDPTRLLRALIAHSAYGLEPDQKTINEIAENAARLDDESPDTLQPIIQKLFSTPNPASAIKLAHETGMLKHIFPEIEANWDYDQRNPHHNYSLGQHTLNVLKNVQSKTDDPDVRLAALFHDVGKPASAWPDENGVNHYYEKFTDTGPIGKDHAMAGAEIAEGRLRQNFNYPNVNTARIRGLIENHMFPAFSSPKGARKFLKNVGPHADDLLTLREGDMMGKGQTPEEIAEKTSVDRMRELVEQTRNAGQATDLSSLAVNGNDLIGAGIPRGPQIGQTLNGLLNEVVENPELNDKAILLQKVTNEANPQNSF